MPVPLRLAGLPACCPSSASGASAVVIQGVPLKDDAAGAPDVTRLRSLAHGGLAHAEGMGEPLMVRGHGPIPSTLVLPMPFRRRQQPSCRQGRSAAPSRPEPALFAG